MSLADKTCACHSCLHLFMPPYIFFLLEKSFLLYVCLFYSCSQWWKFLLDEPFITPTLINSCVVSLSTLNYTRIHQFRDVALTG